MKMESKEKKAIIIIIALIAFYALYANIGHIESFVSSIGKGFETSVIAPVTEIFEDKEGECKNKCISINAMGYDLEGEYCRCWFNIEEDKCKESCSNKGTDRFDFGSKEILGQKYCRCWFE